MMLTVEHLHKTFGGIQAVDDCSFTVKENSITALIGPNGAGKSTVFNIISGFVKQEKGDIFFQGKKINHLLIHQRARLGIGRTFQLIRLFPKMTVMENMLLSFPDAQEHLMRALFSRNTFKKLEQRHEQRALDLLKFAHLHLKADEVAGAISYGQQKLLEIAKLLAFNPNLFLLDEPAAGVNLTMLQQVRDLILQLQKLGKTVLLIEHDMNFVMQLSDKVIVLDYGKEIAVGKPRDIQKNQRVIDAYLGVQ